MRYVRWNIWNSVDLFAVTRPFSPYTVSGIIPSVLYCTDLIKVNIFINSHLVIQAHWCPQTCQIPQSTCVLPVTLQNPGLSVGYRISSEHALKTIQNQNRKKDLEGKNGRKGFCSWVPLVKTRRNNLQCEENTISFPSHCFCKRIKFFLRQVNDNLSSTALSPEDTKLEQMGNVLVFSNMFREKAAPRN